MSVMRMGEIQAQEGRAEALREFLISIMPMIRSSAGCQSCELLQDQEQPARFFMIEVWDSIAAHQASVKNIPPGKIAEIRPLLASSPAGHYYGTIAKK